MEKLNLNWFTMESLDDFKSLNLKDNFIPMIVVVVFRDVSLNLIVCYELKEQSGFCVLLWTLNEIWVLRAPRRSPLINLLKHLHHTDDVVHDGFVFFASWCPLLTFERIFLISRMLTIFWRVSLPLSLQLLLNLSPMWWPCWRLEYPWRLLVVTNPALS